MTELGTCFKRVDYNLEGLLHYIDIGDIGLPDIQRPFVWTNTKVRDLFDSMYRGFPVGYLLFWANDNSNGTKPIGLSDKPHKVPALLIVDGQQRLTSLYAVFRGKTVMDENYQERYIEIAFCPRDGTFMVSDAAIKKDPEYIPDISKLWASGKSSRTLINNFIKNLEGKRPIPDDEEEKISRNIDRLFDLQKYPFTALEIAPTVEEEQVADIFVRINSEGVKLNQADFILTLLSVFWDKGRADLEQFCRQAKNPVAAGSGPSPFNHFIKPGPDQLIRVAVALGFRRGRLKSVYQILRGKDFETGEFSPERRDQQFGILKDTQEKILDLKHWHQFFSSLVGAGFRSGELVSSENTLLYSYAFYLIGKIDFGVPEHILQRLIGRWFYASTITGQYTSSPESQMDEDLNRIKNLSDSDGFVNTLEKIINDSLTEDFWNITLPNQLESSTARSPVLFAFYAAQNKLGAQVLFSHKKISDLLDPSIGPTRKALERHHLFPRAWLENNGVTDLKEINQVANFALLEWPDNMEVHFDPPSAYFPKMKARFERDREDEFRRMCAQHALPDGWENMKYDDFLAKRRVLMAGIIRKAFETLK